MNDKIKNLLDSIYLDLKNPASFGGVERLYQSVKVLDNNIKKNTVEEYLRSNDAYTRHKDIKLKFKRQTTLAPEPDAQWQSDLVVLNNLAEFNDGYVYILTCIDVFSRFAWAVPLKTKTGREIIAAFQSIFNSSGRKPQKLQTDKGNIKYEIYAYNWLIMILIF